LALTTDFDILVSHKGKDEGRKEKRPFFFTVIHGTPKQVSDTAQSIGINERTRKNIHHFSRIAISESHEW
jgi:hypothetical protein